MFNNRLGKVAITAETAETKTASLSSSAAHLRLPACWYRCHLNRWWLSACNARGLSLLLGCWCRLDAKWSPVVARS
jgi:hypothetical protein